MPRLEKIYGPLRFREGIPCTGATCEILWTGNLISQSGQPHPRLFLCKKHNLLHLCEKGDCNTDDSTCTLFAHWLSKEWIRTKFFSTWKHCLSKSTNRDFWYDTATKESRWEEPQKPNDHICTSETCGESYTYLLDDVWICKNSGNFHICQFVQCKWTRVGPDGTATCWATKKAYGYGMLAGDSSEVNAYLPLQKTEDIDLSTRKRKFSYVDNGGASIELSVEVPWGLDIGQEIPSKNIHAEIFAKQLYQQNNSRKEKKLKDKERINKNEESYFDYDLEEEDIHDEEDDNEEEKPIRMKQHKLEWSTKRREIEDLIKKGEVPEHHLITEKPYENIEGSIYKTYTETVDNPDHEIDDVGDYLTTLGGRMGGLGGYEGRIEDEEEERAIVFDAESNEVTQTIENYKEDVKRLT
eukprot:TRINITY_DN3147_c0_g1_i3.p1 TRINITY_DN3147_c0_g1~~TRINITY_DN3147_c0_g1_i3.p1  ORF type:complete len:411 (+),score=85.67 TRINITY_DN3147_c0_g1_i3:297-1529(+)